MKTLAHNDRIRIATWSYATATVGTARGYAVEMNEPHRYGENGPIAEENAITNGHCIVWSSYVGAALVNDPSGAYHAQKKAEHDAAIIVSNGETVEIDGGIYTVDVLPGQRLNPRYSDPIKFVRRPK